MNKPKEITTIGGVILLLIVAFVVIWLTKEEDVLDGGINPVHIECNEDEVVCPDGSVVERTGPDCELDCSEAKDLPDDLSRIHEKNQIEKSEIIKNDDQNKIYEEKSTWKTHIDNKYGFEFQYPSDWRKGGDENMPYIGGQWYTLQPGSSVALCFPDKGGCQDSSIVISVVENLSVEEIISMHSDYISSIKDEEFLGISSKTLEMDGGGWKEILFQKGNVTYMIGGPKGHGTIETNVFEELILTFKLID